VSTSSYTIRIPLSTALSSLMNAPLRLTQPPTSPSPRTSSRRSNPNTIFTTPSQRVSSPISAQHLNAPVFVPKAPPPFSPAPPFALPQQTDFIPQYDLDLHNAAIQMESLGIEHLVCLIHYPHLSSSSRGRSQDPGADLSSHPYYDPSAPAYPRPHPNYHLYNRMPVPIPEPKQPHHVFFMRDPIREELQYRAEDIWAPSTLPLSAPEEVHVYHTLIPLDAAPERKRHFGSWHSSSYRAMNSTNGNVYALRRVEGKCPKTVHSSQD